MCFRSCSFGFRCALVLPEDDLSLICVRLEPECKPTGQGWESQFSTGANGTPTRARKISAAGFSPSKSNHSMSHLGRGVFHMSRGG